MSINISKDMKRLNNLFGEIAAVYHEASLKLGISDSVFNILYTVCNNGESCLLNDICKITGLSKQTVNSAIRRLEKDGTVYLEAVNGKQKKVCLTEKGKAFVNNTVLRVIEIENKIFKAWEKCDVEKYLKLTENYLILLEKEINQL